MTTSTPAHRDHPITDYEAIMTADAQLIDVREPDEVEAGSLPGARNIPLGDIAQRRSEIDPDRAVVVFCRAGGRSTQAAELLTDSGYRDVTNLAGGMLAFEN